MIHEYWIPAKPFYLPTVHHTGQVYISQELSASFDTASDEDHVETVLRAEYALLCMAQAFKEEFDCNIEENWQCPQYVPVK